MINLYDLGHQLTLVCGALCDYGGVIMAEVVMEFVGCKS
jgi:hypothetical protein